MNTNLLKHTDENKSIYPQNSVKAIQYRKYITDWQNHKHIYTLKKQKS